MSDQTTSQVGQTFTLTARSELRFEVNEGTSVKLSVSNGVAEVFGAELVTGETYSFRGGKYAAFTWYGCNIRVWDGEPSAYVSDDTPMVPYVQVHGNLEMQREAAAAAITKRAAEPVATSDQSATGPRVLVAGPGDSGKSTFCNILLSYAVRKDRKPMYVDLDPGQGKVGVPGCIGACTVGPENISATCGVLVKNPLTYFYGHASLAGNSSHYKKLVTQLAAAVEHRFQVDPASRAAGVVINSCGWIEALGYDLLVYACKAFKVDTVLVMGHDRLHNDLQRDLSASNAVPSDGIANSQVNVVKLPRSGGVVQRSQAYRKHSRTARLKEYFEGIPGQYELSPSRLVVSFDDVEIYTIRDADKAANDSSIRPIGQESSLDENEPVPVLPSPTLQCSILGLVHAKSKEEIQTANAIGMVHIMSVDMEARKFSMLAPCPGALPGKYLVLGSVKWLDS